MGHLVFFPDWPPDFLYGLPDASFNLASESVNQNGRFGICRLKDG
jgi:hypothetical protein